MRPRRSFTPEFKAQVVLEVLTGVKSNAEACQAYRLKPEVLSRWKMDFLENAHKVFQSDAQRSQEQARIAELERLAGRLSLELEVAKKASSILNAASSRNAP
jgi:transposase-like protein